MLEQVMNRDRPRSSDYVKVESSSTSQCETRRRYQLKRYLYCFERLAYHALFWLKRVSVEELTALINEVYSEPPRLGRSRTIGVMVCACKHTYSSVVELCTICWTF